MSRPQAPLVVVGNGIAGLTTALAAAPRRVVLVSHALDARHTASGLAQGGIAAALAADDTARDHAEDTCAAGAFHNDFAAVEAMTHEAPDAVRWLERIGMDFDRDGDRLALAREGGHRRARIAHAGGDATGSRIMTALLHAAGSADHIDVRAGDVEALRVSADAVSGVRMVDLGRRSLVIEGEVVLATGGIGGLFERSTNPASSQGVGLALGEAAGAALCDLEFVQFHPTALHCGSLGPAPLLTEALRGAGARLCATDGTPLMRGIHPLADLAPRDVVARHLWRMQQAGRGTWLDATDVHDLAVRFPAAWALCRAHGIDPRHDLIPVAPAAHFHMGGLKTDRLGRTRRAGLYAVGEVACTGVHGANRLASNSLLEAVVYGRRLGHALQHHEPLVRTSRHWFAVCGAGATDAGLTSIRRVMSDACGPVRDASRLLTAGLALRRLKESGHGGWQARVAARIIAAAIERPISLGAHHREDLPSRVARAGRDTAVAR